MAFSWSYSGNPATSNKDAVRFIISDTDVNNQLVSDEEIAWAITTYGTVALTAARVARTLAFKFAGDVEKSVGDLRIKKSERYQHYLDLAKKLEEDASRGVDIRANFFVGGTSINDKQTREDDPDRPRPSFERGKFDSNNEQKSSNNDDPRWFYPGGS